MFKFNQQGKDINIWSRQKTIRKGKHVNRKNKVILHGVFFSIVHGGFSLKFLRENCSETEPLQMLKSATF